jgi:hypothetical protein
MSKIVLKKLFDASHEDEKECCICMKNITNFDDAFIMYNCCGKIFHNECMTKNIIYQNFNCPLCNIHINIKHEEMLLKKYATPLFLYKNFKDILSNLTGHSIIELDNLYNSNNDFNSIIVIDIVKIKDNARDNESNYESDYESERDDDSESDNEISEQQFINSLCNCYRCKNKRILHFLREAIDTNDKDDFSYYLYVSGLKFNNFSYENKLDIVCYIIDNHSDLILNDLLYYNWVPELQKEEIPEIYNSFIDNLENFHFDTCEIIYNNFKISIPKLVLDEIETEYKSNGDGSKHEFFKIIKNKSITYIDPDGYTIYKN